jgi:glycosyltransferase involved in cell wall biosynthesis
MLRLGERLGTRHANFVIAVSKHIKNLLYENYESVAAYIPNGVNLSERVPADITLSKFGLEPGRYFIAIGRLVPEKGFHDLLAAYDKLDTDWKLVIVGDSDHKDKYSVNLKKRAAQRNGVVMTGFQKGKALSELYSNAGLFVLPSYHEGLPIVALEAMSYKLPMLLSDIPANKEVALSEETFPVGNVEVLSQKLQLFIENPSILNSPQISDKKIQRLETEFNWDVIARKTADLYQAVAKMPSNV